MIDIKILDYKIRNYYQKLLSLLSNALSVTYSNLCSVLISISDESNDFKIKRLIMCNFLDHLIVHKSKFIILIKISFNFILTI